MSKRLFGGIIGCKDKTSSWHLNGFPYGTVTLGQQYNVGRSPPLYSSLTLIAMQGCVCVFSSHSFWTSIDIPAGVTQEEGHTGFLIHLLSAVHALLFLARRIQPFLSLVDREVESCVLTILIVLHPLGIFIFVF